MRSLRSFASTICFTGITLAISGSALTGCTPDRLIGLDDQEFVDRCLSICLNPNADDNETLPLQKDEKEPLICECGQLPAEGLDCGLYECGDCDRNGDGKCNCNDPGTCSGGGYTCAADVDGDGICDNVDTCIGNDCEVQPECDMDGDWDCDCHDDNTCGGGDPNTPAAWYCAVTEPSDLNDSDSYYGASVEASYWDQNYCYPMKKGEWRYVSKVSGEAMLLGFGGAVCNHISFTVGCPGETPETIDLSNNGCLNQQDPYEYVAGAYEKKGDDFTALPPGWWGFGADSNGGTCGIAVYSPNAPNIYFRVD